MPELSSELVIDQIPFSLQQVVSMLRSAGQLKPFLKTIAGRYVLQQTLQQRPDLTVSTAELDQAVDQFKQSLTAAELQTWLLNRSWDETLLRQHISFHLKLTKLKTEIAAPRLVQAFMTQKPLFDQVVLSRIVVDQLRLAQELRLLIVKEIASFEQLARHCSVAPDALHNGMMGSLSRAAGQAILGFDPYQAPAHTVLEPIFHQGHWWLVRIESRKPASLKSVAQQLENQIFDQWLMQQIQQLEIKLPLECDG